MHIRRGIGGTCPAKAAARRPALQSLLQGLLGPCPVPPTAAPPAAAPAAPALAVMAIPGTAVSGPALAGRAPPGSALLRPALSASASPVSAFPAKVPPEPALAATAPPRPAQVPAGSAPPAKVSAGSDLSATAPAGPFLPEAALPAIALHASTDLAKAPTTAPATRPPSAANPAANAPAATHPTAVAPSPSSLATASDVAKIFSQAQLPEGTSTPSAVLPGVLHRHSSATDSCAGHATACHASLVCEPTPMQSTPSAGTAALTSPSTPHQLPLAFPAGGFAQTKPSSRGTGLSGSVAAGNATAESCTSGATVEITGCTAEAGKEEGQQDALLR